jgi:hypothetical protein
MGMFPNYPKIRPELPEHIRRLYSEHYKKNRDGETTAASLAQRMERWLHRQVASAGRTSSPCSGSTLEIGAGTLNQLAYEPICEAYDIVEPFKALYAGSPLLSRVRTVYADISDVETSRRYDRIISVATLEHICNLPEVVARGALLLSDNGVFQASIPSEGTPLWTLGWKLTTGLEFRIKHGLDYGLLMKHEHVNTAREIEDVLRSFFSTVTCKVFGLNKYWSLYRYYECHDPDLAACAHYLAGLPAVELPVRKARA